MRKKYYIYAGYTLYADFAEVAIYTHTLAYASVSKISSKKFSLNIFIVKI